MYPITLKIKGIGPFIQEQVIDFSHFDARAVFLIHGTTGSGKTTLLDAMCFALYGHTSDLQRKSRHLVSDYLEDGQWGEVSFNFKINSQVYKVKRNTEYIRKSKLDKEMKVASKAWLWKIEQDDQDLIVAGNHKVSEEIKELLGIDIVQFRQIVLLPQGKFRVFLEASSKEKQQTLQSLIGTDLAKYFQILLKESFVEKEQSLQKMQLRSLAYLEQEKSNSITEMKEDLSVLLSEREACTLQEHQVRQAFTKAEKDRTLYQNFNRLKKDYTEALRRERELKKKASDISRMQEIVTLHQEALSIQPFYQAYTQIRDEKASSTQHWVKEERQQSIFLENYNKGLEAVKQHPIYHKQITCIKEKLIEEKQDLQVLREADKSFQAYRQYKKKYKEMEGAIDKLRKEAESQKNKLKEAYELVGKEPKWMEEKYLLLKKIELIHTDKELQDHLEVLSRELETLKATQEASLIKRETYKQELLHISRINKRNLYIEVSRDLKEKKPCPICGSLEHPKAFSKAHIKDLNLLEKEAIVLKKEERLTEEIHLRILKIDQKTIEEVNKVKELDRIKASWRKLTQEDFDGHNVEFMEERLSHLEQRIIDSQEAAKFYRELDKKLDFLQMSIKDKQQAFRDFCDKESKSSCMPLDQQVLHHKVNYIHELENQLSLLQKTVLSEKLALEKSKTALELQESLCKKQKKHLEKLELEFIYLKQKWEEALDKSSFKSAEQIIKILKVDTVELEEIKKNLYAYIQDKKELKNLLSSFQAEVEKMPAYDLSKTCEDYEDLQTKLEYLIQSKGALEVKCRRKEESLQQVSLLQTKIQADKKYFENLSFLSSLTEGKNKEGVSFERFILSKFFDKILIYANDQLQLMSQGRYVFIRQDCREDSRLSGGLDIEIFDHFTLKKRTAKTLSGGESFQASLALALGLSEFLKFSSGGGTLDTLFIDEGFGLLDSEALDVSIQTIQHLAQSGRLIGIISHVPELQEKISQKIEIKSLNKGSRVKARV